MGCTHFASCAKCLCCVGGFACGCSKDRLPDCLPATSRQLMVLYTELPACMSASWGDQFQTSNGRPTLPLVPLLLFPSAFRERMQPSLIDGATPPALSTTKKGKLVYTPGIFERTRALHSFGKSEIGPPQPPHRPSPPMLVPSPPTHAEALRGAHEAGGGHRAAGRGHKARGAADARKWLARFASVT